MSKILFAEDDTLLAQAVQKWLESEKYTVEHVPTGTEAGERLVAFTYDAIVLDWQLPGKSGVQVCREFRARGGVTPIIMLTGLAELNDKITGLDAGADDYLTKPFQMQELTARLRALLRRPALYGGDEITAGNITVNTRSRAVTIYGAPVKLQPKEYAILELLARHPNTVFSGEEILSRIWADAAGVSTESLYTYIKTLRKKLSKDGVSPIRTVHGQGYCLDA